MRYGNGRKAYLSAIIDLYDHSIVSWKLGHSNNNPLVMDTVKKAMRKNPGVRPLLHSDHGFQYTSYDYKALQVNYKFTKSMSRVGRCLDNQPIEHFWGTFKEEKFYQEAKREECHLLETLILIKRCQSNGCYTSENRVRIAVENLFRKNEKVPYNR